MHHREWNPKRPYLEQQVAPFVWTGERAELLEESRQWSAQDLALRLFVAAPDRFKQALRAYAVDSLEHFREYPGSYDVTLATTPEAKARMKREMIRHFQDTAFGARCQIEDFASDEKFAVFVFHEDEMAPFDRFNESGVIEPDWQRPVVRLAAVFQYDTCTLLVKASRKNEREKLRDLFAEVFIQDPEYFADLSKTPKFNFDVLRDPDFDFPTHGVDGIDEVSVVRVVARTAHHDAKRVTIELRPGLSVCRGLRDQLGSDALIVLTAKPARAVLPGALRTAVVPVGADPHGRIDFSRALGDLVPDYRDRVLDDPDLDLDFVQLRFSTLPGERHRLEINGHDFGGLRKSDLKFLRLLLLACARIKGDADGWLSKTRLRGGSDKDRDLDDLRKKPSKYEVPGLSEDEQKALIKARRGTGKIRLAVPPENIILDESLAELTWMTPTTTKKRGGGRGKVTTDHEAGMRNAATLLRDCRRLGAPGDAEAVKTPTSRSTRTDS